MNRVLVKKYKTSWKYAYFIPNNKGCMKTPQFSAHCKSTTTTKTRSTYRPTNTKKPSWSPYASHFIPLLDMEMETEQEQVKQRLKWSREKLEREGLALFDLSAQMDGALYGQGIVKFFSLNKLPYHRMSQGDLVLCVRGKQSFRGTVLERHSKFLRVVIGDEWMTGKDWKIYQISNAVAFERSKSAVEQLVTMSQQGQSVVGEIIVKSFAKEIVESIHRQTDPCKEQGWISSHGSPFVVELTTSNGKQGTLDEMCSERIFSLEKRKLSDDKYLNDSQQEACEAALERRVTLIQGPPGTGKTKTLARILANLVELGRTPILASAYTHIATDNMLDELDRLNVPAIRIGKPVHIHRDLWKYSLDSILERDERVVEKRANFKKAAERLAQPKRGKAIGLAHRDYSKSLGLLKQVEMNVTKEILEKYPIVLSTCVGAGEECIKNISFQVVVIDEATQSHEPGLLIPMTKGCEQIILAGDHYQLPPTILNPEAAESGLDTSLFERLVRSGVKPYLLRTQYRMHPFIAEFPCQYFYRGLLHSAPCTKERWIPKYFRNPEKPVAFIPVDGEEVVTDQGTSYCNPQEAKVVIETVLQIVDSWVKMDTNNSYSFPSIGIITPYAGQVREIIDNAMEGDQLPMEWLSSLEVKTVDGFQGREKDIIILSTVRSNPTQSLGFLHDWRRLNVSMTRSKIGFVVVGNPKTLKRNVHWKRWLEWLSHQGCLPVQT